MSYKLTIKITGEDRASATIDLLAEVITRLAERLNGVSWEPRKNGIDVTVEPSTDPIDQLVEATLATAVCGAQEFDLDKPSTSMLTGRVCQSTVGHRGRHLFRTPVEVEVEHATSSV